MVDEILVPDDFSIFEGTYEPRRDYCTTCKRPTAVCICCSASDSKININSKIVVLKHPSEEKRSLTTVPLLQMLLPPKSCHVFVGVSFCCKRPPELAKILSSCQCYLVYPTRDAKLIEEAVEPGATNCAFILLDASWRRVKGLYAKNESWLSKLPYVKLNSSQISQYVIKTQPNDQCVSTLEAAALVLNHVEGDNFPGIYDAITEPLKSLCQHQLDHGAQKHESRKRKSLKKEQSVE